MQIEETLTNSAPAVPAANLAQTLLRVAWLAVLLGFVIQLLLLIAGYAFGTLPGIKPLIAEIVNRVAWSTIVCVGLAIGTLAAKAKPSAMALAGLLAAPLAFVVARSLSKGVAQALDMGDASGDSSVFLFAMIKAIEYAWLGLLLGRLGQRFNAGALAFGGAGLATGVIFGGIVLALLYPLALPAMVARGINEILFPIGCALVIYSADALGRRS